MLLLNDTTGTDIQLKDINIICSGFYLSFAARKTRLFYYKDFIREE